MKVLVTGGAGYIGNVLVPKLLKSGHGVRVVDSLWFGNSLPKECEVIKGNICKFKDEWLDDIDTIVNLAATSNDPMADFDPFVNYMINTAGTALVAHKAYAEGGIKFIQASTCSVYGFAYDKVFTETDTPSPTFAYAVSKIMAERALLSWQDRLHPTILRFATVNGYSPRMRYDLVLNVLTKSALQGKIVVNNPKLWRPIVDVRDIADAITTAVEKPEVDGVFNVAEGSYTILQIAEEISRCLTMMGKRQPTIEIRGEADLRSYKVNTSKIARELGFVASYAPYDMVKSIVEKVDTGEISDFDSDKYYNIRIFKGLAGEFLS
jgi:nucleoside-diphosphate-sugar epimerase